MAESAEHDVTAESPQRPQDGPDHPPHGAAAQDAPRPERAEAAAPRSLATDMRGLFVRERQVVSRLSALLVQRARRDFGLRVIALLLAIGLWAFVNAGQRGALVTLRVPVGYRLLPAGMVIVNQHPDFVQIEVRGPRTLLSLLDPDRLMLRLDLAGVGVGQAVFKIGPDMFNVPRQTDVTRVSPSEIVLDIDRIAERQSPIHLNLRGKPAAGYRITSVKAIPSEVTLRGPSRYLAQIDRVQSAPVDLTDAKSDVMQMVDLRAPREGVKIEGPTTIEALVAIGAVIANREFHGLTVGVRDTDHKVKVDPQRVSVTVRGPLNQLSKLDLHGAVYVSADGAQPGAHRLAVQVALPDGIELVRASPENVKVLIYRARRATSG
ncbi:MAG TPA: CdaR family protein [Candidatus Binataceae bacterium]|nr:CdaR family protein [Candidatus Binataceae bacterium]